MSIHFKYLPITNAKQYSSNKRNKSAIKFIVIHDTGNPGKGANAMAHYKYLQNATRQGSAHYFVDDKEVIQVIGDSRIAWAVGDTWARKNATRKDVTNTNSISVELCINTDGNKEKAYFNLVELTKNLMANLKISSANVVRHFDASGKPCPDIFRSNNWEGWTQFQKDIKEPIKLKFDLSKSSTAVRVDEIKEEIKEEVLEEIQAPKENSPSDWAEEGWKWAKEKGITDGTDPRRPATREEVIAFLKRMEELK